MKKIKLDITFLFLLVVLVISGFLIFTSASLGLLSKNAIKYSNVAFNQTFFGLFLGGIAAVITSKIPYEFYKKKAFWIYLLGILATVLVFVPGIGFEHGGAKRWVVLGPISFQPAELLKIAYIIYLSAWISGVKDKVSQFMYSIFPFIVITSITGIVLLLQPDTDTFAITLFAGISILFVSGARFRYLFILGIIAVLGIVALAFTRPYVMSRIQTFINPTTNSYGSGYQINQSLIAIGSGGIYGRGFGQSIQKFNYLPEPIGDSIFAVLGEEFGFVGTTSLILLFIFFSFRGLKIATKMTDTFPRLLTVGIVILLVSQAFVNIGAMVGILPLSGITLPFVSHGGTSLFIALAEAGIVLNISKHRKN